MIFKKLNITTFIHGLVVISNDPYTNTFFERVNNLIPDTVITNGKNTNINLPGRTSNISIDRI